MSDIKQISAPIKHHIEAFEKIFRASMKSSAPLLDNITRYIVKRKGKQIRPMFVFFCAELCGKLTDKSYRAAGLIELLHTATLVHDDVVDDSNERRGFFSLNALWKNKISVLVGDYLLSRGLLLALENDDFTLLRIVSDSVKEMSEGELLQIEKARSLD
ncbi:MAG: polyprenyl synthetase family protein, partial [Bacteroidales bacterium]|nr:polyprenyl synthetase family protein [Bacteroidales bacterium]